MAVLVDPSNALVGNRTIPLNLAEGGQNGAMLAPHQWVSSAGYQKQKIIPVLLSIPEAMRYMDNWETNVATLKALMEVTAISIDGLNSTVEYEFADTPVGNAGEVFHTVTKASRQPSAPSYRWSERYGSSIQRFWTEYARLLMQDPDLGVPGIVASAAYRAGGSKPLLPHMQSMVMLFIEPDETLTNVTHAWMCANMMPKQVGEVTGKREMNAANEVPEVSIEFTATTMIGKEVINQARNYLKSLSLENLRPTELKPFVTGISQDVSAQATGFKEKINESVTAL
jgi:hypothetical protein